MRRLSLALLVSAALAHAGDLTDRYERTLTRVLDGSSPRYDAKLVLADLDGDGSRIFTEFSGDLSGRWVGALASTGRPEDLAKVAELLPRILERQRADGGFGPLRDFESIEPDDMAQIWGLGRLLVGLAEYAEASGDENARRSAVRLGDFLAGLGDRLNRTAVRDRAGAEWLARGYGCWTQVAEGFAAVARLSGGRRFLDAARTILPNAKAFDGEHSHGRLSTLRGMAALAEIDSDEALRKRVEDAWSELAGSRQVRLSGAVAEYLEANPSRDEGCSDADWLRLSLGLWKTTGRRRYLEAAESAYFNGFLANQFSSGDFGHRNFTERGLAGGGERAWWCCTLHGLRAFPEVAGAAFIVEGNTLVYDLPVDGEGEAAGLRLRADSRLAQDGSVSFTVIEAPSEPAALRIRRPSWADNVSVPGKIEKGDGFVLIERRWKQGETLRIAYEPALREVRDGRGGFALRLGPWLLAVSERVAPAYFGQPYEQVRLLAPPAEAAGRVALESLAFSRRRARFAVGSYPDQPQTTTLAPLSATSGSRADYRFYRSGEEPPRAAFAERVQRRPWFPYAVGGLAGAALMALAALLVARRRSRHDRAAEI